MNQCVAAWMCILWGLVSPARGEVAAADVLAAQARHEAETRGLEVPRPLSLVGLKAARGCWSLDWAFEQWLLPTGLRREVIAARCRSAMEAVQGSPSEEMGELLDYHKMSFGLDLTRLAITDRIRARTDGEAPALRAERDLRVLALAARQDGMSWANAYGATHDALLRMWPLFDDLPPAEAWRRWLQVERLLTFSLSWQDGPGVPDDVQLLARALSAEQRGLLPPELNAQLEAARTFREQPSLAFRCLMRLLIAARRARAAGVWPIEPEALDRFGGPSPQTLRATFSRVQILGRSSPVAAVATLLEAPLWALHPDPAWTSLHVHHGLAGMELVVCLAPHLRCGNMPGRDPWGWVDERAEMIEITEEIGQVLRGADGDFGAAGFDIEVLDDGFAWRWDEGRWRVAIEVESNTPRFWIETGPDLGDERAHFGGVPLSAELVPREVREVELGTLPGGDIAAESGSRDWGRRLPDLLPAAIEAIYGDAETVGALADVAWRARRARGGAR